MPYIETPNRIYWSGYLGPLEGQIAKNCSAGELNYIITKILLAYWNRHASYVVANDIMGVLTCAGQEFYRRVVAPYEDTKREANGDVYQGGCVCGRALPGK